MDYPLLVLQGLQVELKGKTRWAGLYWVGFTKNKSIVEKYNFGKDRQSNKIKTSQAALNMIRKDLFNE